MSWFIRILISAALVLMPTESAVAAKQIAFTWSTSFTLAYAPSSGLKVGVNQPKAVLAQWAQEDCTKRYGFLYAEVLGASGKVLGKSNPKLTKKSAITLNSGWEKNGYGEYQFSITTKCSGSMNIPVGGVSNSYTIQAYYQLWNEKTKFKTKDGISSEVSREYSTAELDANNWKVDLVAGQTSLIRCCSDNSWGPAPKLLKLPDLKFTLVETREFNEFEQAEIGVSGKTYIFEVANFEEIFKNYKEFNLDLNPSKERHGESPEEVFARYESETHQLAISIPQDASKTSRRVLRLTMGYMNYGFARWSYSVENQYEFKPETSTILLKSKSEEIRGYSLN